MPRAILLSTGTELTTGSLVDTNVQYLAEKLTNAGIEVICQLAAPDNPEIIQSIINTILQKKPELLIITGGLGPTEDDHTRFVVEKILQKGFIQSEKANHRIREAMKKKGVMDLLDIAIRQTFIPNGTSELQNDVGYAPGFHFRADHTHIFCLPGVPEEMMTIFEKYVDPLLPKSEKICRMQKEIFGLSEAAFQKNLVEHTKGYIKDFSWGVTAKKGYLSVSFQSQSPDIIKNLELYLNTKYQDSITSQFCKKLHETLIEKKVTISTTESCTGGLLGKMLTDFPGASAYYLGGIISYANSAKENLLEVPAKILRDYGAVSPETAERMALSSIEKFQSDFGVSVTGIAGPAGGTKEKPVGTVYIGICRKGQKPQIHKKLFSSQRGIFREIVANTAIFLLLKAVESI